MKYLKTKLTTAFGLAMISQASFALDEAEKDLIRSLAVDGKSVAIVQYTDNNGKAVEREKYLSPSGWKAISPTEFLLAPTVKMKLFGIIPCEGELAVKSENFAGTCAEYAQDNLQIMLKNLKVLYCRSFETQKQKDAQDTTCYGYFYLENAMDAVDNLEEQLVSIGALKVAKKANGTFARPDLAAAQNIGKRGYGMWSDHARKAE